MSDLIVIVPYSFFQVLNVKQGHFVIRIIVSFVFGMILKKKITNKFEVLYVKTQS
jgi:hypothetical protein